MWNCKPGPPTPRTTRAFALNYPFSPFPDDIPCSSFFSLFVKSSVFILSTDSPVRNVFGKCWNFHRLFSMLSPMLNAYFLYMTSYYIPSTKLLSQSRTCHSPTSLITIGQCPFRRSTDEFICTSVTAHGPLIHPLQHFFSEGAL